MLVRLFTAALLIAASFVPRAEAGANLTSEMNVPGPSLPAEWQAHNGRIERVEEAGQAFVRVVNADPKSAAYLQRAVRLDPGAKVVTVDVDLRVRDLKLGTAGWHEPRVALRFLNDAGAQVGPYPAMPNLRQDSDWVSRSVVLDIPEHATQLQLQPGLWLATGTMDLKGLSVRCFASRRELVQRDATPFAPGFPIGRFSTLERLDGWQVSVPSAASLVQTDTGRVLRIKTDDWKNPAQLTATQATDEHWSKVVVRFRMRAGDLRLGDETAAPRPMRWRQGGVHVAFIDASGNEIGDGFGAFAGSDMDAVRKNPGWRDYHAEGGVPISAVLIRITVGFFHAHGTLDIADLSVEPSTEKLMADGQLPAGITLDWGQEKVVSLANVRSTMSLDGIWKFAPAEGVTAESPSAGFGYIKVPGSWQDPKSIIAPGQTREWLMFKGDHIGRAWYQRDLKIPANWNDRQILLNLDRVSTDATVLVDNREVGEINWPGGTVDLTAHLTPGKTHDLRLHVIAVDDRKQVPIYMGYATDEMRPSKLDSRGVIGGVTLVARPKTNAISDVFVIPSTRQKRLIVQLDLARPSNERIEFVAEMLNESGAIETTLNGSADANGGQVTVHFDWPNPRLWDYRQPNLYLMRLRAKAPDWNDVIEQSFGFREFWIDGRKFYLNGTEIRLRPGNLDYGGMPASLLGKGMNFGHIWPRDLTRRGTSMSYPDRIIAEADNVGLLVSGNAPHMGEFANKIREWREDPALRAEYRQQIDAHIRRWRNHPSVVIWTHSANVFQNQVDGTPWLIGKRGFSNVQEYAWRMENVRQAIEMIKEADPSRGVFAHFGTYGGDVYTSNMYLNFIPIQEREEWLSEWIKNGELPFMAVEFGPPLYASLMRGRDGYTPQGHSEPFLTEWAARYLGRSAYQIEPEEYRALFASRYRGNDLKHEYDPHWRHAQGDRIIADAPAYQKLLDLYITNTWRSWRTLGVTGGMVPWHHENHPALHRVNAASLAWIAHTGAAPDPAQPEAPAFTAKDHHYFPGQVVRKQIVLINDTRAPQRCRGTVSIDIGGQTQTIQIDEQLAVSEIKFVPVAADAKAAGSGTIQMRVSIGDEAHHDTFSFDVIESARTQGTALLYDPQGDTTAMLAEIGIAVEPLDRQPNPGDVVVIGRRALSATGNALPFNIDEFVSGGGRLLVMGQDPFWLKHALQLRTADHVARRAFVIDPTLTDLSDDNLRDWNGRGTLVAEHPHHPGFEWVPKLGWHWGNRGSVSSAPIEKPHRTSWRPLLETEFDLAYTPLMEMEFRRGRITFCTLDLEDRVTTDPAARKLATQVWDRVARATMTPKAQRVVYVGDDAGAKLLEQMGVTHERSDRAQGDLVIVSDRSKLPDDFVGRAVVLYRKEGDGIAKVDRYLGSLSVPDWPETRGLSVSDVRWRNAASAHVIAPREGIEIAADGQLAREVIGNTIILHTQLSPDAVPADQARYFRFTRWRQTRALAQVLSNMGATFAQDQKFVDLLQKPDHTVNLAGTWDVQMTLRRDESPFRIWNSDPGMSERAKQLVQKSDDEGFEQKPVPAYLESYGDAWRFADGEVVFRKQFSVPDHLAGRDMFISVGRVDETEETFVNGTSVGTSRQWLLPRGHIIPGRLIKAGTNVIHIRTWDEGIHGGMCGDPSQVYVRVHSTDAGFYHPDYISDSVPEDGDEKAWSRAAELWKYADNPYRYYRW